MTVAERVQRLFDQLTRAVGLAAGVLCQRHVEASYNRRRIAAIKACLQDALRQIEELEKR